MLVGVIKDITKLKKAHVEVYMEKHSSARFTHGLCKDCMKELYGKETWFKNGDEG